MFSSSLDFPTLEFPYKRAFQAGKGNKENPTLVCFKLLSLFRMEPGLKRPSPAAWWPTPTCLREQSVSFFSHENRLVSALGKACSWNCSAVSRGLITAGHFGVKGCGQRSDWYLGSTSAVLGSRWCCSGSVIMLDNLISRKSQSGKACG